MTEPLYTINVGQYYINCGNIAFIRAYRSKDIAQSPSGLYYEQTKPLGQKTIEGNIAVITFIGSPDNELWLFMEEAEKFMMSYNALFNAGWKVIS